MRRVTLRSLWEHKRRLLSTVLAVVLGVSFMSGTFIMSTTLDQSFDDLFSTVVEKVDVVVQGNLLYSDLLTGDQRSNLPESLLAEVREVPGVAAAYPHVTTQSALSQNRVLGDDGDAIGGGQSTTDFQNWIDDGSINAYRIDSGRAPERDDEIVINVAAAEEGDLRLGDDVDVLAQDGKHTYTLVGTFALGAAKSSGGAITVGFTVPEVQRLAGLEAEITSIYVKADDGVAPDELVARLDRTAGGAGEAITGEEAAAQLSSQSQTGFGFLTLALAIFGGIALLVGIFVISNTFSILIAQRTKELALLRALGASRAQILGSVLLEATVVGAVASIVGLLGGLLLTVGVTAGLEASGASLPNASLVVSPDTIAISLFIGIGVTVVASFFPALRATRVPPLAALRDVAIDRSNLSRGRIITGVIALLIGAFNLSSAWRADRSSVVLPVALGAVLTIVGVLVVGPVLAGRTVRTLGSPLPRLLGIPGKLATENAARSPKRTSATASAVIIGVALVVFIQIFAASATKSVKHEVERGFNADFVVRSKPTGLMVSPGIPTSVAGLVREVPGVDQVTALGFGSMGLQYPDGDPATHFVTAIEPKQVSGIFTPRMQVGAVEDLRDDGVIVDTNVAAEHDIRLGDPITVIAPGGKTEALRVQGISDDINLLGIISMTRAKFQELSPQVVDVQVSGTVDPGQDVHEVMADISKQLDDLPSIEVLDREGFIGSIVDQITSYVTLIQGLLVLSIITALFGIANTLSLSISERTRELGLLRAVGMDRTGVRSAVRWEALLISLLGALVGLSLGVFLSLAIGKAMASYGLSSIAFPGGWLGVILVVTVLLGTAAAIRPARRAAGLSILDAIASE